MDYHGIIVDESQKDITILNKLKILGKKTSSNGKWVLYKIGIAPEKLEKSIKQLQENMNGGFYFHFYRENELIVVFKKKIFRITTEKSGWSDVIAYGKSLGIPEKQLDFFPCRIEDETY